MQHASRTRTQNKNSHRDTSTHNTHADRRKPTCVLAQPISSCEIKVTVDGGGEVKYNTTVNLEIAFKVTSDVTTGHTFEFAMTGFEADFENATNASNATDIKVMATIDDPDPEFEDVPSYAPVNGTGCYKTETANGAL